MGTSLYEQYQHEQEPDSLYAQYTAEQKKAKPSPISVPGVRPDASAALARNRPNPSGDYGVLGRGIAANALNITQGIPGAEAAEAGIGTAASHLTDHPKSYSETLTGMRKLTNGVPAPLRIAEKMAGGLLIGKALPIGEIKTMGQAVTSGAKVGAGLGAADAALAADPDESFKDRMVNTVKDAAEGGVTGGAIGAGARAVEGVANVASKARRVKAAPTLGETAHEMDSQIESATRANYGKAADEGAANGGTSPGLAQALNHPSVKPFVDLVRGDAKDMSDADVARTVYKLMSKQRRGLQTSVAKEYDAAKDLDAQRIGDAMKQLKAATAAPSEKPPLTLDVAPEVTEVEPTITPGRETAAGPVTGKPLAEYSDPGAPSLSQALQHHRSGAPNAMQGPGGPAFMLRSKADVVKPGVRIETPGMRIETAPAEKVPPVMPSFPAAVATKAKQEGERAAFTTAADASRRIMRGTSTAGKNLLKQSPEAFSKAISEMSPEEAQAALKGVLGRAQEQASIHAPTSHSTFWGTLSSPLKPAVRVNRIAPFIDQLDKQAGNPVRQPLDIESVLRSFGLLNAPTANP